MTREEAILRIKDHIEVHKYREVAHAIKIFEALDFAIEALRQPEIIRCKDCKYWCEGNTYSHCQKLFNCGVLDAYDYMRAEEDFCSLAERREDG